MKRQRGESCALNNDDWRASNGSRDFRTTIHRSSDFSNREIVRKGSNGLRYPRGYMGNRDTERDEMGNRTKANSAFNSEARKARRRGGVGLRRRRMSATIAVLAISSIAGTSGVAVPPILEQTADKNLDVALSHRRLRRSLQAYNMQQCKIALSVGDIDRDNLLSKSEYLRFVNQYDKSNTNSAYIEVSNYDELPTNLKGNFDTFSDPTLSRIDISGAKPGQNPTSEQDAQLQDLCSATYSKMNDVEDDPPYPTDDEINAEATCTDAVDRGRCNVDLSISDSNQNNLLDESDYVKFVNRLSSNQYTNRQIGQLPVNIKENFYRFATTDGQVNISGSKPGQRVSVEQDIFLNFFCCETDLAVQNPGGVEDPGPPATSAPTFDLFFCQRSMASSDLNRDDVLSKDEYVTFLNRLTNNQFAGKTYDSLDAALQKNFWNLAGDDGVIDIYGSKPGQAANFQNENDLVNVCVETGNALNAGNGDIPTASPVEIVKPTPNPSKGESPSSPRPTPQDVTPTFAPGRSDVYNSFIISNQNGLTASDLKAGTQNRDGLDEAYDVFVVKSVENYDALNENVEIRRALRFRKLSVDLLADSAQIYKIVDSDCPAGSFPTEKCQTAFASFQLAITEGENAQEVSKAYSDYTQRLISEGMLQLYIPDDIPLMVVDASYPVIPEDDKNPVPPTSAPNADNEIKKKRNAGGIATGVIFALLIVGAIAYGYFKGYSFDFSSAKLPSFLKRTSARVGNQVNEDDDEEGRLGLRDDDDDSVGDKNGFGKDFSGGIPLADDDGQKDKNLFGISLRKSKNDDEIDMNYGLDSRKSIGQSGEHTSSDDMYAFEEPSEIESLTDEQEDQQSAFGPEDLAVPNRMKKSNASNWGSSNVFESDSSNQGWGASSGDENFFGTPAFQEEEQNEEEEEEMSQSESEGSEESEESEESESYSSEDDTYQSGDQDEVTDPHSSEQESGTYEELQQEPDSFSGSSSADESFNGGASVPSHKMPSDLRVKNDDMDAAIDNGDWDAVVEAAKAFDKSDQDESLAGSSKRMPMVDEEEDIDDDEESYSEDSYTDESGTSVTTTSEDRRKRADYRVQVEELVKIVLPDETEKVDAMMDQFKGREAELVSTLQTMEERSSNQRARAAVHKSKPPAGQRFQGDNSNSLHGEGATAGGAAIAAASLPIPAEGEYDDEDDVFEDDFGDDAFGEEYDEGEGSQYEEEQSYYSEEGSGSFYSEEEEEASGSRSYYTDEGSGAKSFYSQEEGSPGEEEGSFYEEGASQDEESQEKSFYSQEEGESMEGESYYSEEQEGSRSYYSGEESYVSGEDGEAGSFYSEEDEEESPEEDDQIPPDTRRSL